MCYELSAYLSYATTQDTQQVQSKIAACTVMYKFVQIVELPLWINPLKSRWLDLDGAEHFEM